MRLFFHELRAQQKLFWRNREAAFFSFLFPVLLLVLIGSVYGDEPIEGVDASTFLLIGLLGYGVAANAFAGLAITLVVRREAGLLKRVRGTPLTPATYLSAVIGSTVVVIGLQVVAQLLLGVFLLDAEWPERPLAFVFAILTGAAAFAALGIAITTIVRTAEGSSAVVNAIYLPMAFISGVFFSTEDMPAFLRGDRRGASAHVLHRPHPGLVRDRGGLCGLGRRGRGRLGPLRARRRRAAVPLGAPRGRQRGLRREGGRLSRPPLRVSPRTFALPRGRTSDTPSASSRR